MISLAIRLIKVVNSFALGISGALILPFSLSFLLLPSAFKYPSFASIGLCIAGGITSTLIFIALVFYDDYKQKKGLISGYLSRFSQCSFQRFDISDYAESEESESEDLKGIPYPFLKIYKKTRDIRIYVVKRGRSSVLPNQFVAYESYQHASPSFIFCRDEPEKITALGRFFIYHEFGHTSWRQTDVRYVSRFGWVFFFVPLFWTILFLQYNTLSLKILAVYIVLLAITYPIYKYLLQVLHFYEEVNADRFALNVLSYRNRESLAKYLNSVEQLPNDPSLSKTQNRKRYWLLLQELVKDEKNYASINKYPVGLVYLQFLFAIIILVLGFHIREQSILLCCPIIFFPISALFGLTSIGLKRDILLEKIEKYFSEIG
jgi:hypothetical protein